MHPFPGMNVTLLECAYKMIGNSPADQVDISYTVSGTGRIYRNRHRWRRKCRCRESAEDKRFGTVAFHDLGGISVSAASFRK